MRFLPKPTQRPAAITATSAVLVTCVVATVAALAPGYSTEQVEVDDGSVWVTNSARHMIGHANTQIAKVSTAFAANGADLELLQDPTHLAVHDRTNNTIDVIDPASAEATTTVPLPAGDPVVVDAGQTTLIYLPDSGDVWVSDVNALASFDAKSTAAFAVGVDAVMGADRRGRYLGYSQKSHQLITGNLRDAQSAAKTQDVTFTGKSEDVQATLVAGKPVLYNPGSNELWVDGDRISLADDIPDPATTVLQKPSTTGNSVLVAHGTGMLSVSLTDRSVRAATADVTGVPAAPVQLDGCDFGAWSGGIGVRSCGSGDPTRMTLDGTNTQVAPVLAVNGRTVIANDPASGRAWAVQRSGQLIDNWTDFINQSDPVETEEDERDVPPELESQQKPPVAADDHFGVRADRANTLPVLLNDYDPNGDALIITEVTDIPQSFGTLDIVNNGQEVQLNAAPGASGEQSFSYTISDGRGNTAKAKVNLKVAAPGQNSAPVQVRPTRTSVASGGTAELDTLGDWVDPESDPIFLVDATTASPDNVNFTPDGHVEFIDSGSTGALKGVALSVSDGTAVGNGTASITVGAPGTVPIIAESYTTTGYTGRPIKVEPMSNVRGGTGPLSLNGATASAGDNSLRITPDFAAGTFAVLTSESGTHFVEYSVTDGEQTASGVVRLEVTAPPSEAGPPITVPTTAFLYLNTTQLVDVLATDHDPAGGVLSITGVGGIPGDSGIVVETVEQRIFRVTLKQALAAPVTINYEVTNGHATAKGSLTLVQIPEPTKLQAPVATPDAANARVGSVIDIPVLANDRQPNGKPLILDRKLVSEPGSGTLFVDGDKLRYLAPDKPGEYRAKYRVSSTDGQWAEATVAIMVRGVDIANNRPPTPTTLVARVQAGQKVPITIPLQGIDPDGDIVTLVGQSTSPQLGAVSSVDANTIEYTAGPYSAGTDTFQYTVVDSLGATGTGTIRVGVSPSTGIGAPPVAMDDLVTTRPGAQLAIKVTANDSDPDQGELTIVDAEASKGDLSPTFTKDTIKVTAPRDADNYSVLYTIENPRGGRSSAWLFINVDPKAPLIPPTARDVVLSLSDIAARQSVDVPVFNYVEFSEGDRADLKLSVPAGTEGVTRSGAGFKVAIEEKSRIIPYTVARVDDPTVSASAFIWVPGTDDARPEIRAKAPRLTVPSGEPLMIDINEHVIAAAGRKVTLGAESTISATHASNSKLLVDKTTLKFTSAAGYWGPASITFAATDGQNQAILTLPITVTPKENQPPVINPATINLEAGEEREIDLRPLTDYPYPDRMGELKYTVENSKNDAVEASVEGQKLVLKAITGAKVGGTGKVRISVKDSKGTGKAGTMTVAIVRSSRPIVSAVNDSVTIRRGESTKVDILANDEATNPFPGKPLKVVSVGKDTTLPAGVQVQPSNDKRTLTISVAKDGTTGDITVPYQVADATGDPSRYATGTVSIRIQDVPDAPASLHVVNRDNEKASVTLGIAHAFPNNSPVTKYVVTTSDGKKFAECGNPDACIVSGLTYGQAYQFRAYAVNELGDGAPSPLTDIIVVDLVPNAPGKVHLAASAADPNGHSLRATWSPSAVPAGATALAGYDLTLTGPDVSLSQTAGADATSFDFVDSGITPTAQYQVSVKARNQTSSSEAGTAVATAVGPPSVLSVTASPAPAGGTVVVSWQGSYANGGAVFKVYVARANADEQKGVCDPGALTPNATGTSWTDPNPIADGQRYVVRVSNDVFCRQYVTSGAVVQASVTSGWATIVDSDKGTQDLSIGGLSGNPNPIHHYEYLLRRNIGDSPWTTYRGGLITDAGSYGRATTVFVRACTSGASESCGPVRQIGSDLVPLRTEAAVEACAPPPAAPRIRRPENNGLAAAVEVRYLATPDENTPASPFTGWVPAGEARPASPAGTKTTSIESRVTINGTVYPAASQPTVCQ